MTNNRLEKCPFCGTLHPEKSLFERSAEVIERSERLREGLAEVVGRANKKETYETT